MSGPTCATCRFARLDINDDENTIGYGEPRSTGTCRRFPISERVEIAYHWCGEHTPAEPVGVSVPQLPAGFEFHDMMDGSTVVTSNDGKMWCSARGFDPVTVSTGGSNSYVNVDVIAALIATHRARGGA